MQLKNYNVYFFFAVLVFVSVITFFIFQPFLMAIVLAAILATLFHGMYGFLLRITRQHEGLSALLTSVVALLVFVIPLTVVIGLVSSEIMTAYNNSMATGDFYQRSIAPIVNKFEASGLYKTPLAQQALSKDAFTQYSSQAGKFLLSVAQSTYQSIANLLFLIFVTFFSLYYFLKDGKKLVEKIMYISPLKNAHEKLLLEKFTSISLATVKGSLAIAVVEGVIGAVAFRIGGIPSVATWGVAIGLFSLIPLVGSGIIWMPAALILLLTGHIWQGIFLVAIGFGILSTIDNVLRPRFVGKNVQLHPLLVFFATLGGLTMFGPIGFIVGPIVVALFVSLWDIYGVEFRTQLKKYNV
ncbi:MAG TPA: AI-2E family transporter [Patescibacteria group bacterium]